MLVGLKVLNVNFNNYGLKWELLIENNSLANPVGAQ